MPFGVLILDIDETLAHTKIEVEDLLASNLLTSKEAVEIKRRLYVLDFYGENGKLLNRLWGIKRPHLDTFLNFAFAAFEKVIIWSAGSRDYVEKMVQVLFLDAGHPAPHHVFSQYDCKEMEDGDRVKPIMLLYALEPSLEKYSIEEIVMVDNKESNFMYNKRNGVLIEDYAPEPTIDALLADDRHLLITIEQLKRKLEEIRGLKRTGRSRSPVASYR